MTNEEFKTWFAEYAKRFPDLVAYLKSLDDSGKEIIALWRDEVLHLTPFEDAMEATRRMFRGELEPVPGYERHLTARHVASYAGRIASDRERDRKAIEANDRNERTLELRRSVGSRVNFASTAGSIYLEATKAIESGMSVDEAIDHLEGLGMFSGNAPEDPRRFNCRYCDDSGMVVVWNIRCEGWDVGFYHRGQWFRWDAETYFADKSLHSTFAAPCRCSRGQRLIRNPKPPKPPYGWQNESSQFAENRYLPFRGQSREVVEAWVSKCESDYEASKRFSELDEYNTEIAEEAF